MNARGALGRYGEDVAVRTLTAAGMRILARNWRVGRVGEIDVVARDGDVLVMCEVKTRRPGPFGHPSAAITAEKAKRLRRLAELWLAKYGGHRPEAYGSTSWAWCCRRAGPPVSSTCGG